MTIDDNLRDEKLQYNIKREAAEILAVSSGEIENYEYLRCEKILLSNQREIIKQAKVTDSPLGKAFENKGKQWKSKKKKQIDANKNQIK